MFFTVNKLTISIHNIAGIKELKNGSILLSLKYPIQEDKNFILDRSEDIETIRLALHQANEVSRHETTD